MRNLLLSPLFLALLPVSSLQAQEKSKPAAPIKTEMKKFDKALDAVIDFLEDGKTGEEAPMAEVAAAQAALQASKQHPPRITGQQPKEQQAAFVRAYRIAVNKMIRSMLDLEDALLQGDNKAAQKAVDDMVAQKKNGHRTFKGRRRRARK
jgi:soluble cytochrome b562